MFDLEKFYNEYADGEKKDFSELIRYLNSFKYVIIRGAAKQGEAVGKKLLEEKVKITAYWDVRAAELRTVNGIKVEMPFENEYPRDETVIIYAIPNNVIIYGLMAELKRNGYKNIVRGDALYAILICQYKNGDILSAVKCWQSGGECRSLMCPKAERIIRGYATEEKEGERIDLAYGCFLINSVCNLSCRDCSQYIPNYPAHARNNVPFEIISRDIDKYFDIIDTVGAVSVMGGETFLHPDIAKIANKFSEKKTFGFISFPTNGLCEIKPEQLEGIEDPRIVIVFGNYLHRATEQQKEIYYKNIELVKKYKIAYSISQPLPSWIDAGGLKKLDVDENYMTNKKQSCMMPPRNLQVKNGKVHTCDKGVAIYNMGIADYPTDYLDLTLDLPRAEYREKFREFRDRAFYYTCGHCENLGKNVECAIQGVKNVL